MDLFIETKTIGAYGKMLAAEEKSAGTIEKYLRDVKAFALWLDKRPMSKEETANWRHHLLDRGYTPTTINSMLSSLNRFFRFIGHDEYRCRFLRIQRRIFRDPSRDLSRNDYQRLLQTAEINGNIRLKLLMETICATGIRVSEVPYITTDAIKKGRARISMKGKLRTILIPAPLCRKLRKYATKHRIGRGEIFLTKNGTRLERKQIWAQMKTLCKYAGIERNKVFPHNLRHLFARCFYRISHDISSLADVLGHSSIETTRIYLISTESEHIKKIAHLGLVQ